LRLAILRGHLDDPLNLPRDVRGRVLERPKRLGLALAAIARHFDLGETYIGHPSCAHVVSRQRLKQAQRDFGRCPCAQRISGASSLLRSVGAVEPVANRLALRLIEQQMKLGAAEQKVLSGHGVLDLGNMNQLGLCHASSDLLRKVRIA